MKERIQKVIAATGVYSRRAVERLIDEKKIKLNGALLTNKGVKIDPEFDKIIIAGKPFRCQAAQQTVVLLLNKPRQVVVTRHDPEGRKTIYDLLPKEFSTLKPVGRLDFNTQGALLLTNDGDLILKLTHPRYHINKVYEVKSTERPDDKKLERLRRGVVLEGTRTLPAEITIIRCSKSATVIRFVLQEGKNRQIRHMCELVDIPIKELKRVSIGPIAIKTLRSGQFRRLTKREIRHLSESL